MSLRACEAAQLLEEVRQPGPLDDKDAVRIHSGAPAHNVGVHASWQPRRTCRGVGRDKGAVQVEHNRQMSLHTDANASS